MPMYAMPKYYFSDTGILGDSDIIESIKKDHREVQEYYYKYKSSPNMEEGKKWFHQFVWEISRHSVGEEVIMYNMMEAVNEQGKKLSEESREDHRKLKVALEDLRNEKDDAEFDKKFDKVFSDLMDHIKKEESEDLQFIRDNISEDKRKSAARMFALKKNLVPTRPHPEIPDKPTALELALGLFATPIDKIRDLFVDFPDKEEVKNIDPDNIDPDKKPKTTHH